jgi:hypothetical protein
MTKHICNRNRFVADLLVSSGLLSVLAEGTDVLKLRLITADRFTASGTADYVIHNLTFEISLEQLESYCHFREDKKFQNVRNVCKRCAISSIFYVICT